MSELYSAVIPAALAITGAASLFSDARPPERYQQATTLTLDIQDQAGIDRSCHPLYGAPPQGSRTYACTIGDRVVLPNPCSFPATDAYARMLCHELAHVNGWPAVHGD